MNQLSRVSVDLRHDKQDALKAKIHTSWGQIRAGYLRSSVANLNMQQMIQKKKKKSLNPISEVLL